MAVLQKPVQCCSQAARFMKDKAQVLEGGGDGEDLTVHMPGASCWAMEDDNLCLRHLRSTFCSNDALADEQPCVLDCPHCNGLRLSFARLFDDAVPCSIPCGTKAMRSVSVHS